VPHDNLTEHVTQDRLIEHAIQHAVPHESLTEHAIEHAVPHESFTKHAIQHAMLMSLTEHIKLHTVFQAPVNQQLPHLREESLMIAQYNK
jgi:hypothetical protein